MDLIEQPDRADAGDLFCELCESGDTRLFLSIVAAVDAGVDTARDKGEGDDLKERPDQFSKFPYCRWISMFIGIS